MSITIPAEIITEILYRLPAKSIGRFRCVSKSWLSQLTHPNFIKIHLNNNNTSSHQNKHLIFTTPGFQIGPMFLYSHPFHSREFVTAPTKFDLQLNSNPVFAIVRGSCNGLVLVRFVCGAHTSEMMVVINPTTKECLQLPQEENYNFMGTNNNYSAFLGSLYGFGYDSVTDDYKVVSLSLYYLYDDDENRDEKMCVDVYSLRNKKWRQLADSHYDYLITPSWGLHGVFFNGFIHWIVRTDHDDDQDLPGIAAFSLANECFSIIPFPRFCSVNDTLKGYDCQLFVHGGKLGIFVKSDGEVWLMNEYGVTESWTNILLHGIDKVPLFKSKYYTKPSVFDDNGKILVANRDRMMVYEVEKATFTETVCAWNSEKFCITGFYLESLVSPKLGKDEEDKDDNAEDENEKDDEKVESEEDDAAKDDTEDESEESDEDTSEGIRAHIEFSEEEDDDNDKNEEDESKEDDANDLWKAKHQEEKLRADRLEEELTHALSKIKALERRTMEQDDEIESLKARVSEMVKNSLNST